MILVPNVTPHCGVEYFDNARANFIMYSSKKKVFVEADGF
jgi:hypothetical protein